MKQNNYHVGNSNIRGTIDLNNLHQIQHNIHCVYLVRICKNILSPDILAADNLLKFFSHKNIDLSMKVIIVLWIFFTDLLLCSYAEKIHFYIFCITCNVKRTLRRVGLFGIKVASLFCAHALSSQFYALTTSVSQKNFPLSIVKS